MNLGTQLGFHHDMRRCTGCRACLMACRNSRGLELGMKWREVYAYRDEPGRHYLSVACNHCANPECLRVCASGVYSKREDGVVIQNTANCTGCRLCTLTCPHGAPRYSAKLHKVTKCDLCAERLAASGQPACVAACPTRALSVINVSTADLPGAVAAVPGFPGSAVTMPSVRFTVPARRQPGEGSL